jgi:hypothetical protein
MKAGWCIHRSAAIAVLTFSLYETQALAGDAPEVSLRVPPVSGFPGEEVAVEFRADVAAPIAVFSVQFDVSRQAASFIRTEVKGTASANVAPRGIWYDPHFFDGGYMTGIRYDTQSNEPLLEAGKDLLLVKAVLRIEAGAKEGEYPIALDRVEFTTSPVRSMTVGVEGDGVLRVEAPAGPRPVGGLSCTQSGPEVSLTWKVTETCDAIEITSSAGLSTSLDGDASSFVDRPAPGPIIYTVTAVRDGARSVSASCEVLVLEPRPAAPSDFTCETSGDSVSLSWVNPIPYDGIGVLRNGRLVADLPGDAQVYSDSYSSSLLTVYTLKARAEGVEALPSTCRLNESSGTYVYWVEEARAEPGAVKVPVRIFATNPEACFGLTISLRIDPALAEIDHLTIDGTASDEEADWFHYQPLDDTPGETAAGIMFDMVPPYGFYFLPGADQHVLTVVVNVRPETPEGTVIPVELGTFGTPALATVFGVTSPDRSQPAEIRSGSILVGASPVPEVKGARAEVKEAGPGGGAAGQEGVLLAWENAAAYSAIRIERDGSVAWEIPGGDSSSFDPDPGPGVHRYRIVARRGGEESFPAVVTALPAGIPGTFVRGDANSSGAVDLADAAAILDHLFRGGAQPSCLDAADADDSGRIDLTDPLTILYHLFLGAGPLPAPGPGAPWFDGTEDGLPCG